MTNGIRSFRLALAGVIVAVTAASMRPYVSTQSAALGQLVAGGCLVALLCLAFFGVVFGVAAVLDQNEHRTRRAYTGLLTNWTLLLFALGVWFPTIEVLIQRAAAKAM